jgi:hypothetical protein
MRFGDADCSAVATSVDAEHQPSSCFAIHRGLANLTGEDDQHAVRKQECLVDVARV